MKAEIIKRKFPRFISPKIEEVIKETESVIILDSGVFYMIRFKNNHVYLLTGNNKGVKETDHCTASARFGLKGKENLLK